jgi:Tol biopolymer transport system component
MRDAVRVLVRAFLTLVVAALAGPRSGRAQDTVPTMVSVQDVSWSADGRHLFFSAMRVKRDYSDYEPDKWAVYRFDLDGGAVIRIVPLALTVAAAPAEAVLIVGKRVAGNRDLYLVDENGRELSRLTTDTAEDYGADWSPDGRRIVFTSKRAGRAEVYVANRDGSEPRRLVEAAPDRTYNPAWSPDGGLITFYREKGDGRDQVHVVRPDGSGDVNVTNDTLNNIFPGWTPDGRIVYGRGSKTSPTLAYTVRSDGRDKGPLFAIHSFFTRYSRDGSRIAYLEQHPEGGGIRVVIADPKGRWETTVPLDEVGRE